MDRFRNVARFTFRRAMTVAGDNGWATLLVMGMLVGGLWAFSWLAEEVLEGETAGFDEAVMRHVYQWTLAAPDWLNEVGRDCTALGGLAILSLVSLAVVGYLLMTRKWHAAILMVLITAGTMGVSGLLKDAFNRPRPTIFAQPTSHVITTSFPSGHSMLAASVWLTIGAMLSRLVPDARLKFYCIACCAVPPLLTGLSRVWTGVHWPTDVFAGWLVGCAWAALCWALTALLQRRGKVERDSGAEFKSVA